MEVHGALAMSIGTLNPLVCPFLPRLVAILDPIAPSRTAARAKQPKKTGAEGEGHSQPDGDIHAVTERAMDVVFLQCLVEAPHQGGVEYCGGQSEGDQEQATDGGDNSGGKATEAAEESKDTDQDFDNGCNDCDNVGDEHPFGGLLISMKTTAELFTEELVDVGVVQAPNLDGIEPELVLAR